MPPLNVSRSPLSTPTERAFIVLLILNALTPTTGPSARSCPSGALSRGQ